MQGSAGVGLEAGLDSPVQSQCRLRAGHHQSLEMDPVLFAALRPTMGRSAQSVAPFWMRKPLRIFKGAFIMCRTHSAMVGVKDNA